MIKFKSLLFLTLGVLFLEACGLDDDSRRFRPQWNTRGACDDQQFQVGIPGNSHCPYEGNFVDGQFEAFAKVEYHGAFYIDFGFQYNDACSPGYVPVYSYEYGVKELVDCESISNGNTYLDTIFYYHHNSSECSGAFAGDLNCVPH